MYVFLIYVCLQKHCLQLICLSSIAHGVGPLFAAAAGGGNLFAAAGAFALSSGLLAIFYGGFLYNSVDLSLVVLPGIAVSLHTLAVSSRWRYFLCS